VTAYLGKKLSDKIQSLGPKDFRRGQRKVLAFWYLILKLAVCSFSFPRSLSFPCFVSIPRLFFHTKLELVRLCSHQGKRSSMLSLASRSTAQWCMITLVGGKQNSGARRELRP
jgi:hypothetical protein